jgi:TonB family protein
VADSVASATSPPGAPAPATVPPATSAPDAIPTPPPGARPTTTEETPQPPAAPEVDAERAFDELARAQRLRLSRGDGGGRAGSGSGGGGTGLGLATELSGRQVLNSPVVAAPVVVEGRPVECELPATLRLLTVVHVLVTRDGSAAVPRVLRSSGHPEFDRCALRYVLAMRFTPGVNDRAQPLDVWMNVRVTPVSPSEVGAAE